MNRISSSESFVRLFKDVGNEWHIKKYKKNIGDQKWTDAQKNK